MQLDQLEAFLYVAKCGSISQASEEMFLGPSSIITRIKALEDELNTELFIRSGRTLHCTEAGRILLHSAEKVLNLMKECQQDLQTMKQSEKGAIQIYANPSSSSYILPNILHDFRKRYPHIIVYLSTHYSFQVLDAVIKDQCEIGIIQGEIKQPQVKTITLFTDSFIPVIPPDHPWNKRSVIHASEFVRQPILAVSRHSDNWKPIEQWFQYNHISPWIVMELDHFETTIELIGRGYGISFMPKTVVMNDIKKGKLGTVDVEPNITFGKKTNLIYQDKQPLSPYGEQFIKFIRAQFQTEEKE